MPVPVLTGPRLILRAPGPQDREATVDAVGDYDVSRWLAVVPHPYTLDDADDFLALCARGELNAWAITLAGRMIGAIGLDSGFGYWLARPHWGQGFATEAGRLVLGHHFDQPVSGEIFANYFVGNEGSRRVLEKLGFRDIGASRTHSAAQGREVEARRMRLTRADWAASQA